MESRSARPASILQRAQHGTSVRRRCPCTEDSGGRAHSKAQDAPSGQCLGDRTQKRQEMYVQSGRKCTHKQRASEGEGTGGRREGERFECKSHSGWSGFDGFAPACDRVGDDRPQQSPRRAAGAGLPSPASTTLKGFDGRVVDSRAPACAARPH